MVTINFTIVVQLLLFIGFMWAIDRILFKPLLTLMDKRQYSLSADKEKSLMLDQEVTEKEQKYSAQLASIHRKANSDIAEARRMAVVKNNDDIAALRRKADQEIQEIRDKYRLLIRAERPTYPALASEVAADIAVKIGLE